MRFSSLPWSIAVKLTRPPSSALWATWDLFSYSMTSNHLNARRRMCFSSDPIPNYPFPPRDHSQVVQNGWIRLAEIASRQSARSVIGRNEYQVPSHDLSDRGFWRPQNVMNRSEIWDLLKGFSCLCKSRLGSSTRNILFFVPCAPCTGD